MTEAYIRNIWLATFAVLLVSCSPPPKAAPSAGSLGAGNSPPATGALVTATPRPVSVIPTLAPVSPPGTTATSIPTLVPIPSATAQVRLAGRDFPSGTYRVGVDIAAGTYRARQPTPSCIWWRYRDSGRTSQSIIASEFQGGPALVTVKASDYDFASEGCGVWTTDLSPITVRPDADLAPGTYMVGAEVAQGTWRSTSSGNCYFARLSGFSGENQDIIVDKYYNTGVFTVTISASDKGFKSTLGCAPWQKVS